MKTQASEEKSIPGHSVVVVLCSVFACSLCEEEETYISFHSMNTYHSSPLVIQQTYNKYLCWILIIYWEQIIYYI